LTATGSAR